MTEPNLVKATPKFDRPLNALVAWVTRHKDGSVIKYVLDAPSREKIEALIRSGSVKRTPAIGGGVYVPPAQASSSNYHLTAPASLGYLCKHDGDDPIFTDGTRSLYVCDSAGGRNAAHDKFDLCIDGGGVVSDFSPVDCVYGDAETASLMKPYQVQAKVKRTLKLNWVDRGAPPVEPKAWIELAKYLKAHPEIKKITTICQGGHGRSGTAAVALMMCWTDYSPLDAITHLRAMHCARAIESKTQHQYLDWLAAELGRPENALEAEEVKDFRARFMVQTHPWADEARARLVARKLLAAPTGPQGPADYPFAH